VTERDRLAALQAENERLVALLDSHGIQWRQPPSPQPGVREPESTNLSTDEKVGLFRRLFRGRVDVYPVRWESKTSGKSGYAPACGNEWRPGICEKPRIKCGDCGHRLMLPVSDEVIFGQFAGKHTVGIHPLLQDAGHPALLRMWDKRQRGRRAMGYRVLPEFDSLRSDAPMMHTAKQ